MGLRPTLSAVLLLLPAILWRCGDDGGGGLVAGGWAGSSCAGAYRGNPEDMGGTAYAIHA